MATVYKVHEAKTNLSKLIERVEAGEEVVIARGNESVAKLVRFDAIVKPKFKREPGTMKGKVTFDDSFFDPLPEDELRRWEGYED